MSWKQVEWSQRPSGKVPYGSTYKESDTSKSRLSRKKNFNTKIQSLNIASQRYPRSEARVYEDPCGSRAKSVGDYCRHIEILCEALNAFLWHGFTKIVPFLLSASNVCFTRRPIISLTMTTRPQWTCLSASLDGMRVNSKAALKR